MSNQESPRLEYTTVVDDSGTNSYVNRVLVATPTRGIVRIEWVQARYGQMIPVNWSMVQLTHFLNGFIALRYQVADAQNMIVKAAIEGDFQWLLLNEDDTCMPPDAFIRFNEYMLDAKVPVVSGLYYTKGIPSEPLVFRGRGTSYYGKWEMGDKVWCDGVPTGCLLIHVGLLKAMWDESPEYMVGQHLTRRVFNTPRNLWFDPERAQFNTIVGTSDLNWCTRVMDGDYFAKSGWHEYKDKEWPFLVDTEIMCRHITMDGVQYP